MAGHSGNKFWDVWAKHADLKQGIQSNMEKYTK